MVWCANCSAHIEVEVDETSGTSYCPQCGRVVEEVAFASSVQFTRGADGEGEMMGQMVGETGQHRGSLRYSNGRVYGGGGDSHEQAIARGRTEITGLVDALRITPTHDSIESAHRLYKLALQRGFTRGRRVNQVAAACLYIYCRQERKPYMLIDFSDHLSINIYSLGAVYLQLLRLFSLDDSSTFTKPVDPSLYLHRFVDRLKFGDKSGPVSTTALKLVQSMKRDWMQTGRRPSGICGAAVFIAAHIHGCERSKRDIISVVHVGWHTIEKRVVEFAHSQAGDLTLEDFERQAQRADEDKQRLLLEYEKRQHMEGPGHIQALPGPSSYDGGAAGEEDDVAAGAIIDAEEARRVRLASQERTGACDHVASGMDAAFAHGMCRNCFEEFITIAGDEQGCDPPAYTRGVLKQIRKQVLSLPIKAHPPGLPKPPDAERLLLEDKKRDERDEPGRSSGRPQPAASQLTTDADQCLSRQLSVSPPPLSVVGPATAQQPAAVGEEDDAELAPELQELDEALRREELGRLARALGATPDNQGTQASPGAVVSAAIHTNTAAVCETNDDRGALLSQGVEDTQASSLTAAVAVVGGTKPGASAALAVSQVETQATQASGQTHVNVSSQPGGTTKRDREDVETQDEAQDAQRASKRVRLDEAGTQEEQEKPKRAEDVLLDDFFGGAPTQVQEEQQDEPDHNGLIMTTTSQPGDGPDSQDKALVPAEPEEEEIDNLSDIDDEDIDVYLATAEETEVKTMLWTEMNKEWLEKQALKAQLAKDQEGQPAKPKRSNKKGNKPALPPAETAGDAAKSMLEAKKLSNKINYSAFEDLFGTKDGKSGKERGDSGGGVGGGSRTSSGLHGSVTAGQDFAQGAASDKHVDSESGLDDDFAVNLGAGAGKNVQDALKKRAAARAAEKAQDANKYALALQQDRRGRSALSGGFLGSLTFMSGNKAGQTRPKLAGLGNLKQRPGK